MPSAIQLDPALLAAGCWLWTGSTWVKASGDGTGRLNVNIGSSTINVPVNIAASAINVPVTVQNWPGSQNVRPSTGVGSQLLISGNQVVAYSAARCFWISFSNYETANRDLRLRNGTTVGAAILWQAQMDSVGNWQHCFFPPLEFSTGIYIDSDSVLWRATVKFE